MTNEEAFQKYLLYDLIYKKNIYFKVTTKCNVKCKHCSYGDVAEETMSYEVIDKVFEELDKEKEYNIILYGGEPMLEPEICKHIAEKAHSINFPVLIYSNGFWGSDQNLIDAVDRMDLDCLILSIDELHDIEDASLENIIEHFKNKNIVVSTFKNDRKWMQFKERYPFLYPKLGRMLELGRNRINKINVVPDELDFCFAMGWRVSPNGDIGCECCRSNSCTYGNIASSDINEMMSFNKFYAFDMPNYCDGTQAFNYFEGWRYKLLSISPEEAKQAMLERLSQGEPI